MREERTNFAERMRLASGGRLAEARADVIALETQTLGASDVPRKS